MRWSYLVPRVVLVSLVWVFFAFAFDPLLRYSLIFGGTRTAGAQVEIEGLNTGLFPPVFSLKKVAVANRFAPETNLVEFDDLKFHLEGEPLLRKSFIVNEGSLTGLRIGTARATSGAFGGDKELKDKVLDEAESKAAGAGKQVLDNLLGLAKDELDPKQFESVRLADEMEDQWKLRLDELKGRSKAIKERIQELEQLAKAPGRDPLQKVEAYSKIAREVEDLLAQARQVRVELQTLPPLAREDFARLDDARKRDEQRIREKISDFQLDGELLSKAMFGKQMAERVAEATSWIQYVRNKMGAMNSTAKPQRMRGIDVMFPLEEQLPRLLVRKMHLSGQLDVKNQPMPFSGTISDLTSDPAIHGKPTLLNLQGSGLGTVAVRGVFDHTVAVPVDTVQVDYRLPVPRTVQVGDSDSLSFDVYSESTVVNANLQLQQETLSGTVTLIQEPVMLTAHTDSSLDPTVQEAVREAAGGIRQVRVDVTVSGTLQKPRWDVDSNVGPELSQGLNGWVARKIETQKSKWTAKLDQTVTEKANGLAELLNGEYGQLLAGLDLNEETARGLVQRVAGNPAGLGGKLKSLFR